MTDKTEETWYIVKQTSQQCQILSAQEVEQEVEQAKRRLEQSQQHSKEDSKRIEPFLEKWGPYAAKNQAIAKRIGLIRAGKCQPVRTWES